MARPRVTRRWTSAEDRLLTLGSGTYGWKYYHRHFPGRTLEQVRGRMARLYGTRSLTRGVWSVNQVMLSSGYSLTHLLRAQRALGQKWKRTTPGGVHLLSEEQVEELLSWLQADYWSKTRELYGCVWCGTTTGDHVGYGFCTSCYWKHRRYAKRLGFPFGPKAQLEVVRRFLSLRACVNALESLFKMEARLQEGRVLLYPELKLLGQLKVKHEAQRGDR